MAQSQDRQSRRPYFPGFPSTRQEASKLATAMKDKKAPSVKKAAKPATTMKAKAAASVKKAPKKASAKKEKTTRSSPKKK
jgi:hypothetical protein